MTEDDKKLLIDSGIKIGLVFAIFNVLKDYLPGSMPGRVDRVKFDREKTQNRYIPTGTNPPTVEVIPDPWNPSDLARRLFTAMNGLQLTDGDRMELFAEIDRLGTHRARWLHNYWLDKIDPKDTLFRWIDGEQLDVWNMWQKEQTLNHLISWGVGF